MNSIWGKKWLSPFEMKELIFFKLKIFLYKIYFLSNLYLRAFIVTPFSNKVNIYVDLFALNNTLIMIFGSNWQWRTTGFACSPIWIHVSLSCLRSICQLKKTLTHSQFNDITNSTRKFSRQSFRTHEI